MHYTKKDIAAFWANVQKGPDCWLWIGPCDEKGKGKCVMGRETLGATCAAYQLFYGYVPNGTTIEHKCDEVTCVRPSHLFLEGPRPPLPPNQAAGERVFTPKEEEEIMQRLEAGEAKTALAREFGVARLTIYRVLWRHNGVGH